MTPAEKRELKKELSALKRAEDLERKTLEKKNRQLKEQIKSAAKKEALEERTEKLKSENARLEKRLRLILAKEECATEECEKRRGLAIKVKESSREYVDLLKFYYEEFFQRLKHFWGLLLKLFTIGFVISAIPYVTSVIQVSEDGVKLISEINKMFPILGLIFAIFIFLPQNLSEAVRLLRAGDCIKKLEGALYPDFEKPALRKLRIGNSIVRMPNAITVVWATTIVQCAFAVLVLCL